MGNLISLDTDADKISKHSGFSSTITDSFTTPTTNASGVTWDGTYIISCDWNTEKIYLHSGFSSTISDSFFVDGHAGYTTGITTDGLSISHADNDAPGQEQPQGTRRSEQPPQDDPLGLRQFEVIVRRHRSARSAGWRTCRVASR